MGERIEDFAWHSFLFFLSNISSIHGRRRWISRRTPKMKEKEHEFVQICWLIVIKHHDVVSVATVLKKQYHHDKSFKTQISRQYLKEMNRLTYIYHHAALQFPRTKVYEYTLKYHFYYRSAADVHDIFSFPRFFIVSICSGLTIPAILEEDQVDLEAHLT